MKTEGFLKIVYLTFNVQISEYQESQFNNLLEK